MNSKILIYPNKRLLVKSKKVKNINTYTIYLLDKMFGIMYVNQGIGLAAIQIGVNLKIIVIDINVSKNKSIVLINPIITNYNVKKIGYEACLSFPGIYVKISRFDYVKVLCKNPCGKIYQDSIDLYLCHSTRLF